MKRADSLWGANIRRASVMGLLLVVLSPAACKGKVSQKQCDELLDRFSELVVKERFPDAGPEVVNAERTRERAEAKGDEFKNCTSEVQANEHACAMKAASSEALIKCLE
ncbi:MAG: hypothetical protein JWP87_70 [Labilithrix sp.]|nr:hypothetical protein [Labilithrix sp.]